MQGNQTKKLKSKQSRRIYLFGLLTAVFFLAALFVFPDHSATSQRVSVQLHLKQVDQADAVKDLVIAEIKKQLSPEILAATLQAISATCDLQSEVLGQPDAQRVRSRLMSGAFRIDAIENGSAENRNLTVEPGPELGFAISLEGSGTRDEVEFVRRLADGIQKAVEPQGINEQALATLSLIQTHLRESGSLSSAGQKSLESSLEKINLGQLGLYARVETTDGLNEPDPAAWELKNLTEQRDRAYREYQSNQGIEFRDKQAVQSILMRRIEYLDQEIERLKEKIPDGNRLANGDPGVQKASFVDDRAGAGAGSSGSSAEDLKADLALAINKLNLMQNSQEETLQSARELSGLLQQGRIQVTRTNPEVHSIHHVRKSRVWILLAVSGVLGGLVVTRFDPRAFANYLHDRPAVESALQLPVIGQVDLPHPEGAMDSRLPMMNRWVRGLTRVCEWILVAAMLLLLAVLWLRSDISASWLNDPLQVLRNSFT